MSDAVAAPAVDSFHDAEFLGHPKGLYVCFVKRVYLLFELGIIMSRIFARRDHT